jgi:DNA-binding transcriptional MerR regulator
LRVQKDVGLSLEELADAAGMTARNVRAYQSRGLLPPPERQGRQVRYGAQHIARLRLVRSLHAHGLSLKVVRDLIDQGTAEEELAQLAREHLRITWTRATRVPMSPVLIERYERLTPGGIEQLIAAGIVVRENDRLLASATTLGLVSALLARKIEIDTSGQISLAAAEAADACEEQLRAQLADIDREVIGLVVQLAAAAYADVLAHRLGLW